MIHDFDINKSTEVAILFNERVLADGGTIECLPEFEAEIKRLMGTSIYVKMIVPYYFQKSNLLVLVDLLLSQLQLTILNFRKFKKDTDFKISYSSQQRAFKSLLNKVFEKDRNGRSFNIQTAGDIKPAYFVPISTDGGTLADALYAGLSSEAHAVPIYAGFGNEYNELASFIVYAPIECLPKEKEIIAWVNYYRFASKNFRIEYI